MATKGSSAGYTEVNLSGTRKFQCDECGRNCTSKRRVLSHISNRHAASETREGPKSHCYDLVEDQGKTLFRCKICRKTLSRKQRILEHLSTFHKKSPVKKTYLQYSEDSTKPIPKRTKMRHSFKAYGSGEPEHDGTESEDTETDSEHGERDDQSMEHTEHRTQLGEVSDSPDHSSHGVSETITPSDNDHDDSQDYLIQNEGDDLETSGEDESELSSSPESSDTDGYDESDEDEQSTEQLSKEQVDELCLMSYVLRHNLSSEATKNLVKLLSALNPSSELSVTRDMFDRDCYKTVDYCLSCNTVFPDDVNVFVCQKNGCENYRYKGGLFSQTASNKQPRSSFVIANIESQLKQVFERNGIWSCIRKMRIASLTPNDSGDICDTTDGASYRKLCAAQQFLSDPTHISAMFNTDGIPLYSSSKIKLWPIFLTISELPPPLRFARENLLLAGLWQGKGNPPFYAYLNAFSGQMTSLYENGIEIMPADYSEPFNIKFGVFCGTMDLQAKAYVLNMTAHNGEYGCSTCEEPGKSVKQGKGHSRCYPFKSQEEREAARDSEDIKTNKAPQATSARRIKGICGTSGLSSMYWFDLVDGIVPDYMHGVLLGITKRLLYLWFAPSNSNKPYFIGKDIKKVAAKMNKICPPDYIERLPRDLEKNYNNFKATEYQSWLLFYSLPCLNGYLPVPYIEHFALFSEGIYLLLGDRVTRQELDRADVLLQAFYKDFSILYDEGSCGLNVHNLVHLVHYVEQWGPLWAWSCFSFEDANAVIKKSVHGTGDVTKQYIQLKELQNKLNCLDLNRIPVSCTQAKLFLSQLRERKYRWAKTKEMDNCQVAGALLPMAHVDGAATLFPGIHINDLKKAKRIEVRGQHLYSEEYTRMRKRICYVVRCDDGSLFAIKYFVIKAQTRMVFAVANKIVLDANCFIVHTAGKHIFKVKKSVQLSVVEVGSICEKVFFIDDGTNMYVACMPNMLGHSAIK